MNDLIGRASGEFWILIGSGIGLALGAVLLTLIGMLRECLFNLIPKMVARLGSYPAKKDAEQNHKIYTELVELRVLTDADRSYVIRFHNGSEFLPDNPRWKVSCTHEIVRSGVTYESSKLQEILVSRIYNIVDSVITGNSRQGVKVLDCATCRLKPACQKENKHIVVIQTDELESSFGRFMMESHNVKTVVQVGIVDNGGVIGIVGVDFCDNKLPEADYLSVGEQVCKAAEKIRYHLLFKDVSAAGQNFPKIK